MPKITIDRDVLVREIDDLVKVNADADAKGLALDAAIETVADVQDQTDKDLTAAHDKAREANAAAADAKTVAEVASQVADTLLTKQIEHLKALVSGQSDDPDPTDDTVAAPSGPATLTA